MAVPIAIGIIGGVLFFGDFILSLSKDSFVQAKESKEKKSTKEKPSPASRKVGNSAGCRAR